MDLARVQALVRQQALVVGRGIEHVLAAPLHQLLEHGVFAVAQPPCLPGLDAVLDGRRAVRDELNHRVSWRPGNQRLDLLLDVLTGDHERGELDAKPQLGVLAIIPNTVAILVVEVGQQGGRVIPLGQRLGRLERESPVSVVRCPLLDHAAQLVPHAGHRSDLHLTPPGRSAFAAGCGSGSAGAHAPQAQCAARLAQARSCRRRRLPRAARHSAMNREG